MGKGTDLGLAKPDDPIFSGEYEMFSRPGSRPSTKSSPSGTTGGTPAASTSPSQPSPTSLDPNGPETEEDGIKAEALRRLKARRMSQARPAPTKDSSE